MALLRVYIPIFLDNKNEIFYKGFTSGSSDTSLTIYLTKFGSKTDIIKEKLHRKSNAIYGYSGDGKPKELSRSCSSIILNKDRTQLCELVINGQLKLTDNTIIMFYDYDKIRDSQTLTECADISKLQDLIHKQNGVSLNKIIHASNWKIPYWLSSSMFLQHICNYLNLVKWLMGTIKKDSKVSIISAEYFCRIHSIIRLYEQVANYGDGVLKPPKGLRQLLSDFKSWDQQFKVPQSKEALCG